MALGLVISQSATGTVACSSTIDIVVSTGQPSAPDVTGMTEAAAVAALDAVSDISSGNVTYEYSDTIAIGLVISQSATGTVACSSTIDIVVSLGDICDLNSDGSIDWEDVMLMGQNWQTAGPVGDCNGDGIVDLEDYSKLAAKWLK
ncbi:MAG: PASTA domain-containing protein [Planctomycetes bacterium]|nr:PASTA domain-containing protein [Planctomycetota bacterium]